MALQALARTRAVAGPGGRDVERRRSRRRRRRSSDQDPDERTTEHQQPGQKRPDVFPSRFHQTSTLRSGVPPAHPPVRRHSTERLYRQPGQCCRLLMLSLSHQFTTDQKQHGEVGNWFGVVGTADGLSPVSFPSGACSISPGRRPPQSPLPKPCMRFSRTRLSPRQSIVRIPPCHGRWRATRASLPVR